MGAGVRRAVGGARMGAGPERTREVCVEAAREKARDAGGGVTGRGRGYSEASFLL